MKRGATLRAAATIGVAAIVCSGAGMAQAQAYSPSRPDSTRLTVSRASVQPDVSCPSRNLCTFSGDHGNGTRVNLPTVDFSGSWQTFGSAGVTPNPGSLIDNSGSAVYLVDKERSTHTCMPGDEDFQETVQGEYGWFFITYGVAGCGSLPPGAP